MEIDLSFDENKFSRSDSWKNTSEGGKSMTSSIIHVVVYVMENMFSYK